MSDKIISTLYDHYKDTCLITSEAIKRRDRLMLLVIIALSLLGFQSIFPVESNIAINDYLNFKFGLSLGLNLSVISSLLWFLLLIFVLRYFQIAVFVERQYPYLHKIEDKLNKELNEEVITREGKSYLLNYPCFSNWMWALYTIIFPILLFLIAEIKIVGEFSNVFFGGWSFSFALDFTIFILLAVSIVLYLLVLHKK